MYMEKRGISHIEVILAFLLFIGGVATAVYIFDPVSDSKLSLNMNKYTSSALEEEMGTIIDIYGIVYDKIGGENSFQVELGRNLDNLGVVVRNSKGEIISYKIIDATNGKIAVAKGNGAGNKEIVYAYVGEDISSNEESLSEPTGTAEIVSFRSLKILSQKKADSLKRQYETLEGYSTIKESLGLPKNMNFDFKIIFNDGQNNIIAEGKPGETNIFVDKKRKEILRIDNKIEYADFEVRTW